MLSMKEICITRISNKKKMKLQAKKYNRERKKIKTKRKEVKIKDE